jgi:hypothetical protein
MRVVALLMFVVVGAICGAILGLLLGLGALALPGLGPRVAAGTLATALGTAGIGAVIGTLAGGGIGLLLQLIRYRSRSGA